MRINDFKIWTKKTPRSTRRKTSENARQHDQGNSQERHTQQKRLENNILAVRALNMTLVWLSLGVHLLVPEFKSKTTTKVETDVKPHKIRAFTWKCYSFHMDVWLTPACVCVCVCMLRAFVCIRLSSHTGWPTVTLAFNLINTDR